MSPPFTLYNVAQYPGRNGRAQEHPIQGFLFATEDPRAANGEQRMLFHVLWHCSNASVGKQRIQMNWCLSFPFYLYQLIQQNDLLFVLHLCLSISSFLNDTPRNLNTKGC